MLTLYRGLNRPTVYPAYAPTVSNNATKCGTIGQYGEKKFPTGSIPLILYGQEGTSCLYVR